MFVDCTDWVDWRAWKFSSDQETDYVPDRPDGMAFQATATMRGSAVGGSAALAAN